jgi:hypothetical protein
MNISSHIDITVYDAWKFKLLPFHVSKILEDAW